MARTPARPHLLRSHPSVKDVARRMTVADNELRREITKAQDSMKVDDSFQNFALSLGLGTNNPMTASTYGFNPLTRERTLLEWIHRGSWLGGMAVDLVADDMTRAGVDILGELDPEDIENVQVESTRIGIWEAINDTIRWARLYGGCIAAIEIDGQDPRTPLRLETVGRKQFKGLTVLDRWMVDPSLENLVTEPGPNCGMPKYYRVVADAPALRRASIHYSRVLRMDGIRLPYWQRVQENLWGISVIERLFDRMVAFDAATTGASQLIHKSFLRTLKMKGLRAALTAGGPAGQAIFKQLAMLRRMQSNESIALIDGDDDMRIDSSSGYSGIADTLLQFGQQLSGALQIPLVRLFGQSPAGLSSTGESDLRTYYDGILQQQERNLRVPVTKIYKVLLRSMGIEIPKDFSLEFRPLWQLSEKERAETALTLTQTVSAALADGLITPAVGMKELRQSSDDTGIFTNITDEDIKEAELAPPPSPEELAQAATVAGPASKTTLPEVESRAAHEVKGEGEERTESGGLAEQGAQPDATPNGRPHLGQAVRRPAPNVAKLQKPPVEADDAPPGGRPWTLGGLDIIIETRKGEVRRGGDGASAWQVTMPAHYGFIANTRSAEGDNEEMDCFVGPHTNSNDVWIIHQKDLKTGKFQEHKTMLGYPSAMSALDDYVKSYSDKRGQERILKVDQMTLPKFKDWLTRGGWMKNRGAA